VADETPARDAKIVQYLNEAYGKEKQLETALQAHIGMTTRAPYKKRLQQHLRETKDHAKQLERRIKKLGGTAEVGGDLPGPEAVTTTVANIAGRAVAAAQGPIHALRGTGEAEKMLKNAKDEYHEEAEEIANYTAIEALATAVNDKDTAKIAKAIRRDEEKMLKFLERLIPQLVKAVAQEEIPAKERRASSASRRRSSSSSSRSSSSRSSGSRSRSGTSSSRSSSRSSSSSSRSSSSRSGGSSRSRSGGSSSSRSGSGSRSGGSSSRSSGSRSSSSRSGGSSSRSGGSSSRSSGSSSRSSSSRSGGSRSGGSSSRSRRSSSS
jgi:ferritin-like metal-binding protein YciE